MNAENNNNTTSRALVNHQKRADMGVRTSWHSTVLSIEPDVILSSLYAHSRRLNTEANEDDAMSQLVVGSLLGFYKNNTLFIEDCFVNAIELEAGKISVNTDHHLGMLDLKMKSQSTTAGQSKDDFVGMIINCVDLDVISRLQDWIFGNRAQSRYAMSNKNQAPVFICMDTSMQSGRFEIRAFQRDRNGIMFLDVPHVIGTNFPKSVICSVKSEMPSACEEATACEEDSSTVASAANVALQTTEFLKSTLSETSDVAIARSIFDILSVNPLMTEAVSQSALQRITTDSTALVYLLKLSQLQAEMARRSY
eukprot:GHVH01002849.1.p1 GENE.GHVH01002849.1~~GHVH01002849.1.p1  ORF type:complete len:309 (-),score=44.82 GHVH01002849.1:140-1066(-)